MSGLKKAFEAKNQGVTINLTPSTSRQLADRILKGETCDVFAPSSSAIADELVTKNAAAWSVVFSANEMVVITAKGNPLGIRQIADLAKPGVTFVRITAEKDLGTGRTIEFLKRAATLEGKPELAQKIVDAAAAANSVPDTVRAVREGKANAGVVYYSAAVAAKNDLEIIRFPASVNLSDIHPECRGRSAYGEKSEGGDRVRALHLVAPKGKPSCWQAGQPPVVPAIRNGNVPADVKN